MINLLRERRSIRKFQDKPVSADQQQILQEALLRCPTSRNFRPWEFIFVDAKDLLQKLSVAKPTGAAFLAGAPLGVVICGDKSRSDVWIEDCSIAAITLQYAAFSLGLGSCWIQIRNRSHTENQSAENYIQTLLNIPAHIKVDAILAIGHGAEDKKGLSSNTLPREKVHHNRYGNPSVE
jgi:nitroreductase